MYGLLVHFVFIWYIFPVLVSCTSKNLATLVLRSKKAVLKIGFNIFKLLKDRGRSRVETGNAVINSLRAKWFPPDPRERLSTPKHQVGKINSNGENV
jgi:hypothetical protein